MEHTIDATNMKLGRAASKVAVLLIGKDASFQRNTTPKTVVKVVNASKIDIDERKRAGTIYHRHSGYRGSMVIEDMNKVIRDKGFAEVFRRTVYGMVPRSKLTKQMMKNLIITE